MFDIFCFTDINRHKDHLPMIKQIDSQSDVNTFTKMYWIIEPGVKDIDYSIFSYRPETYDHNYEHVWKCNADNYGGIRLIPTRNSEGIKKHDKVVCNKHFDVITDPDPDQYFADNPIATHVWCADPEYILPDLLPWAPDKFEPDCIHCFHIPGQLEHKYPEQEGGIKLFPRGYTNTNIKYQGYLDVKIEFPVIRTKTPNVYKGRRYASKYVWLVDSDLKIDDSELQWVPSVFESDMVHNFHIPGQLEFKYPYEQGPVSLVPAGVEDPDIVYHGDLTMHYDVVRVDDPSDFSNRDHIPSEFVWLVDNRYSVSRDVLDFIPSLYDRDKVHNFHLSHQLSHIYPENMGGVYLVPRNWQDAELKVMGVLDGVRYPVVYTSDPKDFTNRDSLDDDYVWLIDQDYQINPESLNWSPSIFEIDYVHNFKMRNQLTEKYPQDMGGIYLVPKDHDNAGTKIHKTCPVEDAVFDVFSVDHTEFTQEKITAIASQSQTPWFWVIDRDYEFNGKLRYIPHQGETDYIHVFKWGMEYRYPKEVTELWDNRVGGIFLVNRDFDWNKKKLHTTRIPIEYDVFYVDDPNAVRNHRKYANISRTDSFWLIDEEHRLPDRINWVPPKSDQSFINVFKLPGQLEHKYPKDITNVSDNRAGGIRLVPRDYDTNSIKFQGKLYQVEFQEFDRFDSVEQGMIESTTPWFWIVDPDVEVADDFAWDYVPDTWDEGKTHVWQVANPVTGLNYDYAGIKLHHKTPKGGRDKYIKERGCTRKPLDILYLDPKQDILEQLNNFESSTYMYYVIDPHVELHPEFKFEVYPTQWDQDCIHLFKNQQAEYRNVRLVPKGYVFDSIDQINNNSYDKLKEVDLVASVNREWPVYYMEELSSEEFHKIRESVEEPWFFTVDPQTQPLFPQWSYEPDVKDFDRVHAWQRLNPHTQQVHSYGGVRLWPTAHSDHITTDALIYNRIPRLRYVREHGSAYEPYPIILLSYFEERAQRAFDALSERPFNVHWVRDIDGIFQAHKVAARVADNHGGRMFWVVDADAEVSPDFLFDYIPDVYDQETVHVWASKNPVTGSTYGYGGVKLFNTQQVLNATSWGLDFTTGLSKKFKFMTEVSCVTKFNTSAYDAWRSAFREVVKLTVSSDADSELRIKEWLNPLPDADYGADALRGAQEAQKFASENKNNLTELDKINDFDWLQEKFQQG